MNNEIEAQFLDINKNEIREKLKSAGAKLVKPEVLMKRVVFDIGPHRFARVRDEGGGKIVMTYKNVADDKSILGTKEVNLVIDDYENGILFLKECGLKVKSEEESYRETWVYEMEDGEVEICIDTWPWIPSFVEVEGPSEKSVWETAEKLGLDKRKAKFGSVDTTYQHYYGIEPNVFNFETPKVAFEMEPPKWVKMKEISPKVKKYIEEEVLPRYKELKGHTSKHIAQVIDRSLKFAKQVPWVNLDMVYVIAAYHDLGRLVDNETHNIESAKMMRADKFLRENFTAEEVETMAEAVEDHRASLGHEPRSVYGKIVSSADRNPTVESILERAYDYNKLLHPDYSEDEIIEDVRVHIREKYSPDGYAAKTMYFKDSSFEKMLFEVERITRTKEGYAKVQREFNKKRFSK